MTDEQIEKFLEGLTELSREHGIVVTSCSCCNGINLDELRDVNGPGYTSMGTDEVFWPHYWKE